MCDSKLLFVQILTQMFAVCPLAKTWDLMHVRGEPKMNIRLYIAVWTSSRLFTNDRR